MAKIITLIGLLIFLGACATPHQPPAVYYSIPTVSYLRETPQYDSLVVAELYAADQVKFLNKSDGWWQVQSLRNEKIGWTQRDLLSENPLITQDYYIIVEGLPLREAPSEDVRSRNLLSAGDLVQKIDQKDGWWRVLVQKDKTIGWIPAKMASETWPEPPSAGATSKAPGKAAPETGQYFVAAETLPMYSLPLMTSQVVKLLVLNSKVVKIAQQGPEWVKIRYLDTGAEGWAQARYLKDSPVTKKNQIVTSEKKSRKKGQVRKSTGKEPPEPKGLEPEGM
jgi:uncharacterized protein YgiM (DUF1202 family)